MCIRDREKIDFSNVKIEPLFEEEVDFDTFSKSDFRAVKVKAVSYTHLDVYKRQWLRNINRKYEVQIIYSQYKEITKRLQINKACWFAALSLIHI